MGSTAGLSGWNVVGATRSVSWGELGLNSPPNVIWMGGSMGDLEREGLALGVASGVRGGAGTEIDARTGVDGAGGNIEFSLDSTSWIGSMSRRL